MNKEKVKIVNELLTNQKEMNELTVDKICEAAPEAKEVEQQVKINYKELAEREGIEYIEPVRKLLPFGTLPEKWRKMRDHDWEYVKGVFENEVSKGESIKFGFSKWPGDPDCVWEVPANRPVYVPRMIAKHLSGEKDEHTGIQAMEYHTFDHIQKAHNQWKKDHFADQFAVTGTQKRGTFRPIGAFS
jgi:hypothetical protein